MIKFNIKRDIGIKISQYNSLAKCINIIRKYREASINDIKSEIESHEFIFTCDFTDTIGLNNLITCYDELSKEGAILTIQEQDRVITRDVLQNLSQMHKELHEETLSEIDNEVDD
ncbi:hypothetical protein SAMN02910289_00334 [Lachnospiraceae bacterium RM5]|nr:hypothetical protein SAMN02910289_00334 [Lachnospiraceae bacterium RM5]